LGDGKTIIPIQGVGTVQCYINDHLVTLHDVRYVPALGESIYSLFIHIKTAGHGLESSYDDGLFITFPSFKTKAIIGATDIYLDIKPITSDQQSCDSVTSNLSNDILLSSADLPPYLNVHHENLAQDKLLPELRCYYHTIKTKRQLKVDVPASFCQLTSAQRLITPKTPPRKSSKDQELSSLTLSLSLASSVTSDENTVIKSYLTPQESTLTSTLHHTHSPIVRSVDKASSSLPSTVAMSEDYLKSCVGFR